MRLLFLLEVLVVEMVVILCFPGLDLQGCVKYLVTSEVHDSSVLEEL